MDNTNFDQRNYRHREKNPGGRIVFGLIIAALGLFYLLKLMGFLPFGFRFTWPVILVVIGLGIGVKNGFSNNAWWILVLIGVANLIPSFEIMGRSSRNFVWPILLIIFGVMMAIRPKRPKYNMNCNGSTIPHFNDNSRLVIDVAFGGRKEIITSKDFRGGSVSVAFGGSEINLNQADFTTESILLDCRVAFGGIELVVPPNWELQNEIKPAFGTVEDERVIHASQPNEIKKKLILTGNCTFGSIEIKSY